MFSRHVIKELSSYIDNQLSEARKLNIEKHLKTCGLCSQELTQLKLLSEKLKTWQASEPMVDFESSVRNKIVAWELERGAVKMKKKTLTILIPSGVLAGILVFLFVGQIYIRHGLQARIRGGADRIKESTDRLGSQFTPKINYEFELKDSSLSKNAYVPYYYVHGESDLISTKKEGGLRDLRGATTQQTGYQTVAPPATRGDHESWGGPQYSPRCYSGIPAEEFNTEQYDRIYETDFLTAIDNPLSTFSIDVDTASYSNIRRFLNQNQLPPKDAVRIEEMINYFTYGYPEPKDNEPFSITTEIGTAPWKPEHKLVLIGLQGRKVEVQNMPSSNLVFLIDVSGSMQPANKLPLLKSAFKLLVDQLRPQDKVAIVVYAGSSGLALDSTPGNEKHAILGAIEQLQSGGCTAGAGGIKLAYEIAKKNYIKDGNNRVILATDGDFNIGITSDGDLTRLIEEKRNDGIFLTVLGFGMGNYKDAKMEKLADKGNGNFAYIDNLLEAKKVFVSGLTGTLLTIAKDVKIQVEFNPAKVKAYRLVGYENRMLKKEDFNDDKKDAGEIGAGHSVTALYEIVLADSKEEFSGVDPLQYQEVTVTPSSDVMTVKLRYKDPDADTSKLITKALTYDHKETTVSENFNFASAVAEFGLILRDSQYKGNASYEEALKLAKASKGQDADGYRAELIKLVEIAQLLSK